VAKRQNEQVKEGLKRRDDALIRSNWLIDRLTVLSEVWKRTSDADLQRAVNELNAAEKLRKTAGRTAQGVFVKVDFSPEECYGASKINLWRITGTAGGIGNFVTDDEMFSQRGNTCRVVGSSLNARAKVVCPIAGTGHPNVLGASKYAEAIMQQVGVLLRTAQR
jgi:hypothetical protein